MDNPNSLPGTLPPGAHALTGPDSLPGSLTPGTAAAATARQNDQPVYGPIEPISTAQPADGKPIVSEIATVRRNIYIPPTYQWILLPRDPTLRTRGAGWDYTIYEQAEQDPKVFSMLQKRKGALAAYPVQVDAASDAPADLAAAELIRRAIAGMNFELMCQNLLDALLKGFAVVELMWGLVDGPDGREWRPVDALPRDQRRFRFDEFGRARLLDWQNLLTGELLPDRKFVIHTINAKDGDPYGRGLGLILWWNAYFKRQNMQAWLVHNEKFGSPTAHGTYPQEASDEEKNALFAAVQSFSTDSAIISSEGTDIKLLETARAAGADTFKVLRDAQDEDIAEVVLGSSYAAHAGPLDGGSGAAADQDDRLELAQADANNLAHALNATFVAWTVEFNLPGARPPTIKWLVDAEEDLSQRADRDLKITQMGFEAHVAYISETYGGIWTRRADAPPPPPPEDIRTESFAEPGARAPTTRIADALTQQLSVSAAPAVEGWVGAFRKMIEGASSLEEARDRLIDLYPKMDGRHFAETMESALHLADLAGRMDSKHGR